MGRGDKTSMIEGSVLLLGRLVSRATSHAHGPIQILVVLFA